MKIHLLSGFLGSGKTTAIAQAVRLLMKQGIKTGVITNDQGNRLVDGSFFESLDIPNREVINGCFCCNYNDLDAGIASLIENEGTEIIFAESVGSCTDIVATVLKPLLQFGPEAAITLSVFADARLLHMMLSGTASFDETVHYIYLKQLEEAGIIIVSKIDLVSDELLSAIKDLLQTRYCNKQLIYQNSLNPRHVEQWIDRLDTDLSAKKLPSLNIDYPTYASGEAKMAWLDQSIEIFSPMNTAMQQAEWLINEIGRKVTGKRYPIGHLKFLVNNSVKLSFTAVEQAEIHLPAVPAAKVSVLINMRVETMPAALEDLVVTVIKETQHKSGCSIIVNSQSAFQPGYPGPVFRM
jgi:hypothetical protein